MKPIKRQLHGMHKTLTINAPLNQVWEVLADFNNIYT